MNQDHMFSNETYDRLKFLALVVLPALAVLYLGLAPLWELPKQEAVSGTIMLVDTFLGALLGLSTKSYDNSEAKYDGTVLLTPDAANGTTDAAFQINPNSLEGSQKQVVLKVENVPEH